MTRGALRELTRNRRTAHVAFLRPALIPLRVTLPPCLTSVFVVRFACRAVRRAVLSVPFAVLRIARATLVSVRFTLRLTALDARFTSRLRRLDTLRTALPTDFCSRTNSGFGLRLRRLDIGGHVSLSSLAASFLSDVLLAYFLLCDCPEFLRCVHQGFSGFAV